MKILSMTNDGQLDMLKNMLNSAERVGIDLNLFHIFKFNKIETASNFWTMEFYNITKRKLELIYDFLKENDEVLWVDNDIVFFENVLTDIEKYNEDIVMQDDIYSGCTGFWKIKKNKNTLKVLSDAIIFMNQNIHRKMHDQTAVWWVLNNTKHNCSLKLLPREEYPVGDVYFKHNIDRNKSRILHNNFLFSTNEKIQRFINNNMWDPSDNAFNKITYIYTI